MFLSLPLNSVSTSRGEDYKDIKSVKPGAEGEGC